MATFVLIPGAGGAGEEYWREAAAELRARGHTAIPVEIEGDDPALGLPEYAAVTDEVIGTHRDVVVVAQSFGGFTVPMITKRDAISRIVFVNAMIPLPGEAPGQWWDATGWQSARHNANVKAGRSDDFDVEEVFLHDLPDHVKKEMVDSDREPAETPFKQPCAFEGWPDVPLHVLVSADDRFFPADFQVRVARKRLGITADIVPGGHLVAKSRPSDVAERLIRYVANDRAEADGRRVPFDLVDAAAELRRVAENVGDDQLECSTPCTEWTVRDLVEHVCGLTKAFTIAARHEKAPEALNGEGLPRRWRDQLDHDLETLVAAWREPSAWDGEAEAGGVRMPAAELAAVALDELVLHGWDLARATGQNFAATTTDVEICTGFAAAMSTPESRGGLFGPLVDTAPDASPLDTLLGFAGRDPAWR